MKNTPAARDHTEWHVNRVGALTWVFAHRPEDDGPGGREGPLATQSVCEDHLGGGDWESWEYSKQVKAATNYHARMCIQLWESFEKLEKMFFLCVCVCLLQGAIRLWWHILRTAESRCSRPSWGQLQKLFSTDWGHFKVQQSQAHVTAHHPSSLSFKRLTWSESVHHCVGQSTVEQFRTCYSCS